MIPIKLSIQGLYSYQDIQEIDFQRLIGASVFGIFGKVGSGKTSLLEAISFALYGETERLNSRDNRLYNMMNLKSKDLRIDFEFQAGPEQQLYKFVYEAKRHPKKHHEISSGERRMFIQQEKEWHPIGNEKEDISTLSKQILGLDYENFKRTIIIPQNQFREFLELSPTERTKMMNQLFKLDQYDLADRVKKLSDQNNDQLAELRGLLAPLENVAPEIIEEAKAAINTLAEKVEAKEEAIRQIEPEERQLDYAQTQTQLLITIQRELARLQAQEPTYQQLRRTVVLYETCRLVFQADLISLRRLQDKQTGLTTNAQRVNDTLNAVSGQLSRLQSLFEATKIAYDSRHELQQQIDELETVQQIRLLQESIELQTRNRQYVFVQINKQKEKISQFKTDRETHQSFLDVLLGQESQLERLHQIEKWFAIYKPLKKQADDLQDQLIEYEAAVEQIKQRKNDALVSFPDEWNGFTLKTLPAQIDEALERLKTIRKDREKTYQQAYVKQELMHYANALTEGTPCPLCGSKHHPSKHDLLQAEPDSDPIRQEVLKSEKALAKVNQRIDDTTTLRLLIEGLAKELRGTLDNGKRLIQDRTNIIQQLTVHEDEFVWDGFSKDHEDNVTEAIEQQRNQQRQLQEKQQLVRELTKQIDEAEIAQRNEEQKLSEFDNAVAGLNGQLKTATEQLEHYQLAEVQQWDLRQITDLRDSLTHTYEQTRVNFEAAEKQKSDNEKIQLTLTEELKQLTKQLSELSTDIGEIEATLSQNLTKQALTREIVEQVLQSNIDLDQEKQRINEYDDTCTGLQKQIADLQNDLLANPFDPDKLVIVRQQLETLRAQKDDLNKDLGKAGNVLATLEQQWIEKQAHQVRYDDLTLRQQDLKKMDELFRAQGFVNYVSSVYLKNLCESANERFFKLTNNQLRLELDDKNNFLVRDYLNGGEVRSVKTLSGGQTFQAALSLALALSDNIQHLTKARQNLFFLDEGFGTLDKDSLQTVFKTLKALRSENRVVGIISHVDELQQEVDTYIRTVSSENGSRIINSWEE